MRRPATVGSMFALLAAAITACASHDIVADTQGTDATIDTPPPPPRTLTFVIDRLEIDPTDDPSVPHTGFNLDDFYSSDVDPMGCAHYDYYSLYDDDQHCASVTNERCNGPAGCDRSDPGCVGGVDNQLPTLANTIETAANTDIRALLSDAVTHNRLAFLVRVREVDDWTNDPSVDVSIYRAYPTFGTNCDSVLPGREYAVDSASLSGGTDIDRNATYRYAGSIVDGRLGVRATEGFTALELPIEFGGDHLSLPMHAVRLRANIAADALSIGTMGGIVHGDDVVQPCLDCGPDYTQVVRGVIGGLVDLQIGGVCDGSSMNPARYGGISIGFGVHAVPAVISSTNPVADATMPGTCGAPVDDAGQGG